MPRPRKDQQIAFYDEFYSMTPEDQAFAIRILSEHHRYVLSQQKRTRREPETATEQQQVIAARASEFKTGVA